MANGTKSPAALRIKPPPVYSDEAAAAETPPEESPMLEGGATITLAGPDREAFKTALGHECKVGDKYYVELTATEVTPESIKFSIDNVESDYEEGAEASAEAPAAGGEAPARSPAMTYA